MLSKGELVVVNNDGIYYLVPKEVGANIAARDPRRIVADHNPATHSDLHEELDDHYKQFEIPDDLDW
jgi:uncharacterized protein YaiL (DUF2058 family)